MSGRSALSAFVVKELRHILRDRQTLLILLLLPLAQVVLFGFALRTDVHDIREVYGNYAHASASAGLVKSAETQLLSKGNVSLALAGGGEGINIGVEVGAFHIKPVR